MVQHLIIIVNFAYLIKYANELEWVANRRQNCEKSKEVFGAIKV